MDNKINFAGKLLSNPLSDNSEYQEDSDNDIEDNDDDVYIDQNFTDVSTNEMFACAANSLQPPLSLILGSAPVDAINLCECVRKLLLRFPDGKGRYAETAIAGMLATQPRVQPVCVHWIRREEVGGVLLLQY